MSQNVVIREYFEKARCCQTNLHTKRMEFAKLYAIHNKLLTHKSFRIYVLEYGTQHSLSVSEVLAKFALMYLNTLIEDDLLEFVAEFGIQTRNAIKEDHLEILDAEEMLQYYGYVDQSAYNVQNVTKLTDKADLYIVRQVDKPTAINFLSKGNPFSPTNISDSRLDYLQLDDTKKTGDWDKLTEEEWNNAKSNSLQEQINEFKLRKKEKEIEYPDWVSGC